MPSLYSKKKDFSIIKVPTDENENITVGELREFLATLKQDKTIDITFDGGYGITSFYNLIDTPTGYYIGE